MIRRGAGRAASVIRDPSLSLRAAQIYTPAVLASRWSSNLAQMFGLKPGAAAEDVSRAIAAGSAPVLIDANFWSTDWRNGAEHVFDALLHFLENWPSFPEGAKVVACICVSYVRGQGFLHRFRTGEDTGAAAASQ